MPDQKEDKKLTTKEQIILWIWRNALASGAVFAASWYLHGLIVDLDESLEVVRGNQTKAMERHMDLQDAVYDIVAKQKGEYGEVVYRAASVEAGSTDLPDLEEVVPEPLKEANLRLEAFLESHREEVQQHMATQQLPAGSR